MFGALMLAGWAPSFAGAQALSLPDASDVQSLAANAGGARSALGGDMMDSVLEYIPPRFSQVRRTDGTTGKRRGAQRRPAFNVHGAAIRPRAGVSEGRVALGAPPVDGLSRTAKIAGRTPVSGAADDWASAASVGKAHRIEGDPRTPRNPATVPTAALEEGAGAIPAGKSPNRGSVSHIASPADAAPDPWSSAWFEWSTSTHGQSERGALSTGRGTAAASDSAIATTSVAHDGGGDDWTRVDAAGPGIATMNSRGVW